VTRPVHHLLAFQRLSRLCLKPPLPGEPVVPDVPDKQPDEEVPDANPEPPDHPTRRQMNKGWCSCSGRHR